MAKSKFPETIFVVVDANSDANPPSLIAEHSVEEAIDNDGPTEIADYKFVRVRKFRKSATECA